MKKNSFYALVQGRFYKGDIEGKRYHWKKGIPGSKQLANDLKNGISVYFVYYRTWDKDAKKGKYFYGTGEFDNQSLKAVKSNSKVEYFANIIKYKSFSIPVIVPETIRKIVWPGGNRQAGIKKVAEGIFLQIVESGLQPKQLSTMASLVGESNLESLLNDQISPEDIRDSEGIKIAKRTITTQIYKRTKKIIQRLKRNYNGRCQITGEKLESSRLFGIDVTEAHHIRYLCDGGPDSDPLNVIIISPEWHRVLHKKNPKFDRGRFLFIFNNGRKLPLKFPGHLSQAKNEKKN